ncbi:hypothetical protein Dimus_032928 [Dionaea muscipula]
MEETEEENHQHIPLPTPSSTAKGPSPISYSSAVLKDLSNDFKTPKRNNHPLHSRTFHQFHVQTTPRFFTASKQTPSSSAVRYRGQDSASSKSRAARKLKAFEIEQSKSARKELVKKERSLRSLAKSITVWLNFLFENPTLCGCRVLGDDWVDGSECKVEVGIGKRESWGRRDDGVRGIGGGWRVPKRLKEGSWMDLDGGEGDMKEIGSLKFLSLRDSLREVCSFEDLKERMRGYLSLDSCKEVFNVMTQVTKNIDEGRLKMKPHCPIVTDVGMKQKAIKVLMCYDPIWLRIGLYIILGGDSLLPNGDSSTEEEIAFLRMVLEKQVFSHGGLAKAYAYNKMVEGLYRPGYFESLGNVILKRILLLVLILDRAKSKSSLPIEYGIDGLDGGSPLLFTLESRIKSSRQMLIDLLSSDVMHGEGNLLTHLTLVGYKVNYHQLPLIEYEFRVTDLFQDIQDGLRLSRAIQLLQNDPSILGKLVLPADVQKKKLANCRVAMQYLRQAGVPLVDDDGTLILEEDIANGDKELTLSLLWNLFVNLQLPLLITKAIISDEIIRIRKAPIGLTNLETSTHLDMLLNWMKAIGENYNFNVDNFASMVDGKAIWCLLDFYFRKELHCAQKDLAGGNSEESIVSTADSTDAVHNFVLSQKLVTLLGNFPEVLQISDILENKGACNDRSVVILLVFMSSELLHKKSKDQLNFHKFMGCPCQSLERRRPSTERSIPNSEMTECKVEKHKTEDAAKDFKAVQAWWQEMAKRNDQIMKPASQAAMLRASSKCLTEIDQGDELGHEQFYGGGKEMKPPQIEDLSLVHSKAEAMDNAQEEAARKIQLAWRRKVCHSRLNRCLTATKIQSHVRGWITRRSFVQQKQAILIIQSSLRSLGLQRNLQEHKTKKTRSAIVIQSHVRGWISRRGASRRRFYITLIQSHCRGWLARKFLSSEKQAAVKIQSIVRVVKYWNEFHATRDAAIEIQRLVRGRIARTRLLGAASLHSAATAWWDCVFPYELKIVLYSVVRLQKWWRKVSVNKSRTKAAIVIQSHTRGWIERKKSYKQRRHIVLIQSYWKGYLARRDEKGELLDLRLRVQKSAVNVDDGMRIINKHISALNELVSMKSLSNILRICAVLDRATEVSQKCCEMLVDAGAIDILLKQIRSVSRSIPDQEVLKHSLSILRNLARYPHLADVLIDHHGSVQTIFWELIRNKEDGYFIACDLMKRICQRQKGIEGVLGQTHLLKRLHNVIDDLTRRKASHRKRNNIQDNAERRRLKEADELLNLISIRQVNI